jgi:hypothetical protein
MHNSALAQKWKISQTAETNNKKSERKMSLRKKKEIE